MCLINFPAKCPKCGHNHVALGIAIDYSRATWVCKRCKHEFD